uniref:Silicon transporter n=1 Tax=Amphora coffeiformis TaxID=265554 RepID=A0A7S3KWK6_9STRA
MRPLIREMESSSVGKDDLCCPDSDERSTFLQREDGNRGRPVFSWSDLESLERNEARTLFPDERTSSPSLSESMIATFRQMWFGVAQTMWGPQSSDEVSQHGDDDGDDDGCCRDGCSFQANSAFSFLKYAYSMCLLLFSIYLVVAAIFSKQTKIAESTRSTLSFGVIVALILWLGMMEGGQGCLVGLQPIDKTLYEHSHPITLKCTTVAHKGDNMYRFIVGRQFLVVLVVFFINLCGSVVKDLSLNGIPDIVITLTLGTGFPTILMTVILGQLTSQVNATKCMLDFVNTYFMLFTTWVSLAIEMSGLLHAVYLVQYIFAAFSGKPVASNEPPRDSWSNVLFWIRVSLSSGILCFAFAVTLSAIFNGQTTMYANVPPTASIIVFLVLMCFVGLMEGMQIALFAVVNLPEEELRHHVVARKNCELTFRGSNFQAFLIGRQICVTLCMFVVARITTIAVDTDAGEATVLGVSQGWQKFLNTGLPGALITTIVGSLAWRIIASSFPVAFMSNPLIYWTIRLCLFLEASGVCSAAWLLAAVHKRAVGFQLDDAYLGAQDKRELDLEEETMASEVSSENSKLTDYGATGCGEESF